MGKKKSITQIINNTKELNVEIDYDKLAGSIVNAMQKSQEIKKCERQSEKVSKVFYLFAAIFSLLCCVFWSASIVYYIQEDNFLQFATFIMGIVSMLFIRIYYIIFKKQEVEQMYPTITIIIAFITLIFTVK